MTDKRTVLIFAVIAAAILSAAVAGGAYYISQRNEKMRLESVAVQMKAQAEKDQQEKARAEAARIEKEKSDKSEELSKAKTSFRLTIRGLDVDYISEYQFELSLTGVKTQDQAALKNICDSFEETANYVKIAAAKKWNGENAELDGHENILYRFSGAAPDDQAEKKFLTEFEDSDIICNMTLLLHKAAGIKYLSPATDNTLGLQYRLVVQRVGWDGENDTFTQVADKSYDAEKVKMKCMLYAPMWSPSDKVPH